ncbi:unnamed protein product [Somion occarium]|uniref:Glycoside hydrolase family 38 N-terminal domain-containing protein n=1 Tax=Somion occarium TaxID=3059160 RepID=A0ABP1DKL0_9APHY
MNVFNNRDLSSIPHVRKLAEEVFGEGWEKKGEKIYEEGTEKAQIWGIGYCHIDTAWLWPYSVTQQKVAHSWSTQVDLMPVVGRKKERKVRMATGASPSSWYGSKLFILDRLPFPPFTLLTVRTK